jgi:hypothetical protein
MRDYLDHKHQRGDMPTCQPRLNVEQPVPESPAHFSTGTEDEQWPGVLYKQHRRIERRPSRRSRQMALTRKRRLDSG